MPDFISSRANPRVRFASESSRKPIPECFVVEGFHMIQMAYEHHCLDEVFAVEDPHLLGARVHLCTQEIIDKIAVSKNPQPIVGLAHSPFGGILTGKRALVLDRIQDPGNVGTLMRTALAFGFEDIVFLPGCSSPINSKTLASSQGAIFAIRSYFAKNEMEAVRLLKEKGFLLIGSALRDSVPMETFEVQDCPIALVLGNEGKGMSEYLLQQSDYLLKITMSGIESLNVGIAGGILMHKFSLISQ